jgi:hypothetical protein
MNPMRSIRCLFLSITVATLSGSTATQGADGPTPVPLGVEGRMVVVLPMAGLQGRPVTDRSPVHVRVADAQAQGNATRYDLRYLGVRTGARDLRDYLVLADGSAPGSLPPLPVSFVGSLPERHDGRLESLLLSPPPRLGGYRVALGTVAAVWLSGGVFLWVRGRRRPAPTPVATPPDAGTEGGSFDPLRGWVEAALRGELDADGRARLERTLIARWRGRVVDDSATPSEALIRLKAHPEAGPLIRSLEQWLHRPAGASPVDLEAMLAPYRTPPGAPPEAMTRAETPADLR